MCPTEYNKLWSNPKPNTYLDILGEQLDQKIHVMWTGNSVIHDITKEGQVWVNHRLKRPSFVWWNFPVSDYVRNHLLLGPVYGLDKDARADMSGFVSNPMDKAEASKAAIFSVADYTWNMESYDPELSWRKGIEVLVPEVAKSYALFASHNTDPGPSYHQYRRVESVHISADVDSLLAWTPEFDTFPLATDPFIQERLRTEFVSLNIATQDILENVANKTLLAEIKPWLLHFESLAAASINLLDLLASKDDQQAYMNFLKLQTNRNKLVDIDRNNNQNPYQPGIVTGGRHLLPWVEKSYFHFAQLFRAKGFAVPDAADQASGKLVTSITPLRALPVLNDVITGNKPQQTLKLGAMLEVIKISPNDYIGIEVTSAHFIQELRYAIVPNDNSLKVLYSENGKLWEEKKTAKAKFVKLLNESARELEVKMQKFDVVLQ
jgi:hyaluronoglucosaminidase